jgi:hypothetical protein
MRIVGLRSILPLLPTLVLAQALACMASNPTAPEQTRDAVAPPGAAGTHAEAPAPTEPALPNPEAAASTESQLRSTDARKSSMDATDSMVAAPPSAPPRDDDAEADRQSRLDIAVPAINGGLNRDIIRRIASDHADDIRDCHGRALASLPDLAGKLVVHVELDADGEVRKAKIGDDSSLHNRDVESCVLALIEGWSFADAGGKGSADLSFEF